MRSIFRICSLFVAIGAVALAPASEVVYFANGTSMPIRSHRIEGDMVHVVFGGESEMAFPATLIERIEDEAGASADLKPSNRMAPSVPEGLAERLRMASGEKDRRPVTYGGRAASNPAAIPGNNSPYHGGVARRPGEGPRSVGNGDPRLSRLGVGAPTEIQRRIPGSTSPYTATAIDPKAPAGKDPTQPVKPTDGDKGKQAP